MKIYFSLYFLFQLYEMSKVTFSQLLLPLFFLFSHPYPQISMVMKKVKKTFGLVNITFFFGKNALVVLLLLLPSCNGKNKKSFSVAMFWSYNLSLPGNYDLCLKMEHSHRIIL